MSQTELTSGSEPETVPGPEPGPGPVPRSVHLLLWNGVELLDFAGPAQVFRVAGEGRAFDVRTLSPGGDPVVSQGFLRVVPDGPLEAPGSEASGAAGPPEGPDLLVIPGGETAVAAADDRIMEWLPGAVAAAHHVLSVCTGALLLARTGVLKGREATTWHGALRELGKLEPGAKVHRGRRWVTDGRITTTAGVTAGIDAALHLVEQWLGEEEADRVTAYMEHHRVRSPDGTTA